MLKNNEIVLSLGRMNFLKPKMSLRRKNESLSGHWKKDPRRWSNKAVFNKHSLMNISKIHFHRLSRRLGFTACLHTKMLWSMVSYGCIYLKKEYSKTTLFVKCYYNNLSIIYSFSLVINPIFNVTWSFRSSNMLIWSARKKILFLSVLKTVVFSWNTCFQNYLNRSSEDLHLFETKMYVWKKILYGHFWTNECVLSEQY